MLCRENSCTCKVCCYVVTFGCRFLYLFISVDESPHVPQSHSDKFGLNWHHIRLHHEQPSNSIRLWHTCTAAFRGKPFGVSRMHLGARQGRRVDKGWRTANPHGKEIAPRERRPSHGCTSSSIGRSCRSQQ